MISEREAAKYPFLKEAVGLVDTLSLDLEDLADPSYARVLDRAEQRVSQAILQGEADARLGDPLTELISFPVANVFVTVIGDDFLGRRYALSEAQRAGRLMREEVEARLTKMARTQFGWSLRQVDELVDDRMYRFELHFDDYLRNATAFREPRWKLVNRLMRGGYVLLTKPETARLLQEEVQRSIESLVKKRARLRLPEPLRERVDSLSKLFDENRARISGGGLPSRVLTEAFPPCVRHSFEGLMAGRRLSHMERFALTSFLVNAEMDIDEIVNLFVSVTDFDEGFTRYQVEHIAGLRGSRTRYTPPTCSTLRTHGVCHNPDRLCEHVRHPLSYYRIKVREQQLEKETEKEE